MEQRIFILEEICKSSQKKYEYLEQVLSKLQQKIHFLEVKNTKLEDELQQALSKNKELLSIIKQFKEKESSENIDHEGKNLDKTIKRISKQNEGISKPTLNIKIQIPNDDDWIYDTGNQLKTEKAKGNEPNRSFRFPITPNTSI